MRPATLSDVPAIADVQRRSAIVGYAGLFPPSSPAPPLDEFVAGWAQRVDRDRTDVLVAIEGEHVVGVVTVEDDASTAGARLLSKLYVDPDHWGRGIGGALHDAATDGERRSGTATLGLWVLERNGRARAMYEARGWRLVQGRTSSPEGTGVTEVSYELSPVASRRAGDDAVAVVERAVRADAGEIMTVQRAAFLSDAQIYGDPFMNSLTQTSDEIAGLIDDPAWLVLVARMDGRLVGSVRAEVGGGVAEIGRLLAAPDVQGRGLGRALMSSIEVLSGVSSFLLHTGNKSDSNIEFYQRLGYHLIADPNPPPDGVTLVKKRDPSRER